MARQFTFGRFAAGLLVITAVLYSRMTKDDFRMYHLQI